MNNYCDCPEIEHMFDCPVTIDGLHAEIAKLRKLAAISASTLRELSNIAPTRQWRVTLTSVASSLEPNGRSLL